MITRQVPDRRRAVVFPVFFFILVLGQGLALPAEGFDARPLMPRRGNLTLTPAERWEEGLLSGNGTLGAIVFGGLLDETIILSHQKLFLPWEKPLPPVNQAALLGEIRKDLSDGDYQKAADRVVAASKQEGYGEKRWTDPIIPAFELRIAMEKKGEPVEYARALDFETGEVTTRWRDSRGLLVRRLFVSRPDGIAVLSLREASSAPLSARITLRPRPTRNPGDEDYWSPERKVREGIKSVEVRADPRWISYESAFLRVWDGGSTGYEGVAGVFPTGGRAAAQGRDIVVEDAREILILIRVEVIADGQASRLAAAKAEIKRLSVRGFDGLLASHAKIHGEIFNRVRLDLGGDAEDRLRPSEDLIGRSKPGAVNRALLEREFDFSRYAILSSTGEWPPALQGIWTGTWAAPWSGDFTQNGNIQSAVASALSGAMPETLEAYFRYLDFLRPAMRTNALRLFGAQGIVLASRTSTHGLNNHFDRTWPMTFWTAGSAWAARFYYDYWQYTGDRKFLADRAVPFMKEAAAFYEDFLFEGPDGKFVFAPSYSPENAAKNTGSQAGINATMDIALAKELLTNLGAACETLNIEADGRRRWKDMLAKLPAYRINADGAVAEWAWPGLEDDYEHRHSSHLVSLFDGVPPDIAANPDLREAFKKALDMRMRHRLAQKEQEMAFGLVQLGQAAAGLREAKTAARIVDWLVNEFWLPSLSPTHNTRSIFNVDICGGLPAVVIRMLFQSELGRLDFLPALPEEWPAGRIEGLPGRGQVVVESLSWKPGSFTAVIRSAKDQRVTVRAPGSIRAFAVEGGGVSSPAESPDSRMVDLRAGRAVTITIEY